jgi:hypothetical protein
MCVVLCCVLSCVNGFYRCAEYLSHFYVLSVKIGKRIIQFALVFENRIRKKPENPKTEVQEEYFALSQNLLCGGVFQACVVIYLR